MSNPQAVAFASFGLILLGGGGDFPEESDVRSGVAYDTGLVGNLTLPVPAQVLQGVQYGGEGDEFTGTAPQVVVNPPPACPAPTPSTGSAAIRAWEALYRAQTYQVGSAYRATVGSVTGRAIISELNADEIFAAGGTAQAGGYSLQMLVSDFDKDPEKLVTKVSALGLEMVLLTSPVKNNGIYYFQAGDPVAEENS